MKTHWKALAVCLLLASLAVPAQAGDIFGYDPDAPAPQAHQPGQDLPGYLRLDPDAEPQAPLEPKAAEPGFSELCDQCRQLSKDLRAMAQEESNATAHDLHGLTAAAMEQAARFLCVLDAFADVASESVGPLLDMALERTGMALANMKQFLENEVFTEDMRQRILAFLQDATLALQSYTWAPETSDNATPDDRRPRQHSPSTNR